LSDSGDIDCDDKFVLLLFGKLNWLPNKIVVAGAYFAYRYFPEFQTMTELAPW
jgi:hypothetical protein